MAYLPDGAQILTNSRDNTLKLIDLRTLKCVTTFENENYINSCNTNSVSISPGG